MAHAGAMDLGGSALANKSSSRWPAVLLVAIVIGAMIAAAWFASTTSFAGTAAKATVDRSLDSIEAKRGAAVLPAAQHPVAFPTSAAAAAAYLAAMQARPQPTQFATSAAAVAAAVAGHQAYQAYLDSILERAHVTPFATTAAAYEVYLNSILDEAHATPWATPVKRDHVGGP